MCRLHLIFIVVLWWSPTFVKAGGPFGISIKGSLDDYACETTYAPTGSDWSDYWYECSKIPKPHPDLDKYKIKFFDGIGVCIINAGTLLYNSYPEHPDKLYMIRYRSNARRILNRIVSQIEERYSVTATPAKLVAKGSLKRKWGYLFEDINEQGIESIYAYLRPNSKGDVASLGISFSFQTDACSEREDTVQREKEESFMKKKIKRRKEGIDSF